MEVTVVYLLNIFGLGYFVWDHPYIPLVGNCFSWRYESRESFSPINSVREEIFDGSSIRPQHMHVYKLIIKRTQHDIVKLL